LAGQWERAVAAAAAASAAALTVSARSRRPAAGPPSQLVARANRASH